MWPLFRIENEHCTNIKLKKASRLFDLRYWLVGKDKATTTDVALQTMNGWQDRFASYTCGSWRLYATDGSGMIEAHSGHRTTTTDEKRNFKIISGMLADAHRQDFQRKKTSITFEDAERLAEAQTSAGPGNDVQSAPEIDEGFDIEVDVSYQEGSVQRSDDDSRKGNGNIDQLQGADSVDEASSVVGGGSAAAAPERRLVSAAIATGAISPKGHKFDWENRPVPSFTSRRLSFDVRKH